MRNEAYKLSHIDSWVRDRNVSCAYDYRLSTSDEKRRGQWWTREQRGMYIAPRCRRTNGRMRG